MLKRIARDATLGAILVSTVCGVSAMARPKFMQRTSATQTKPSATAPAASPIQWQRDLKTAQRISQSTGRPILIVFGGARCVHCKNLERETLGHPSLAEYINTAFVPVHLDYDKDRRAAQILEVEALPKCVVLNSDAELLGTIDGYVRPPEFTKTLHLALDYQRQLQAERAVTDR